MVKTRGMKRERDVSPTPSSSSSLGSYNRSSSPCPPMLKRARTLPTLATDDSNKENVPPCPPSNSVEASNSTRQTRARRYELPPIPATPRRSSQLSLISSLMKSQTVGNCFQVLKVRWIHQLRLPLGHCHANARRVTSLQMHSTNSNWTRFLRG